MSDEKRTTASFSFKVPVIKKEGQLSVEEFDLLVKLSGDKNKSQFINNAILHYAEVIRNRLEKAKAELDEDCKKLNELFPPKP